MDWFADDGKLGQGFTSADDLVEVDIGDGDRPRPTFISAKLESECKQQLTDLLKEYKDCFAWDYTELPICWLMLQLDIGTLALWMVMQDTIKYSWLKKIFQRPYLDVLVLLGCSNE